MRNVLLVALDPVPEEEIRHAIADRSDGADVNVHVVAPAAHVGKFQWLTGADDDARAEAAELADRTADALDAEVETEVGEHDPLLAVQDALALFPADEILVAGNPDAKTEAALASLGRPISRVGGGDGFTGEEAGKPEGFAHNVAEGHADETPFVIVGTVAAFIFGVIGLVTLIAFLVFWLV
jgi:hypothetical protein